MRWKTGVIVPPLTPGTQHALDVVDWYWRVKFKKQATVTSVGDGKHSSDSLHYGRPGDIRARAFDLRTRDMTPTQVEEVSKTLRELLGGCFDVVIEVDHIHVEEDWG